MQQTAHVIERVHTPRGELQLQRRGEHYEIISNGVFLMATYNGDSERLLVRSALEHAFQPKHVLIGGLGVGFSLGEALRPASVTEVNVIEIEPKVIEWNRTHLAIFSGNALDDPCTTIIQADLLEWIGKDSSLYDAICLDIDNGPDWTVTDANHTLYQTDGLKHLARMLRPHGVITFWSASHSPDFQKVLEDVFNDVHREKFPRTKGEDDSIYVATSPRK